MAIKTVTLAGVNGALGHAIIAALLQAGFTLQVLSRPGSQKPAASGVKVTEIDYDDKNALTSALKGQDAVVSALGATPQAVASQEALILAASDAGVKRFIPSEFGSDLENPRVKGSPVFGNKVSHQKILQQAVAKHPEFSYTLVYNGALLDWGIKVAPFLINVKGKAAEVWDGGDVPFSAARVETVGKAVAGVLQHPDETLNRAIYIHDGIFTQNEIISHVEKVTSTTFTKTPIESSTAEKTALGLIGDSSVDPMAWIIPLLKVSLHAKPAMGKFEKTDNALLGIQELDTQEKSKVLREIIQAAI